MVSLYRKRGKKGSFWPNFFQKTPGKAQKVPEKARKEPKNARARPGGAERHPSKSVFDSGQSGRRGTRCKIKFRGVIPAEGREAGEAGAGRGRCGRRHGVGAPPGGWGGGGRGLEGQARVVLWKGSPPGEGVSERWGLRGAGAGGAAGLRPHREDGRRKGGGGRGWCGKRRGDGAPPEDGTVGGGAGRGSCGRRRGVEAPPGGREVERRGSGEAGAGGAAGLGPRREEGVPARRGLKGLVREALGEGARREDGVVERRGRERPVRKTPRGWGPVGRMGGGGRGWRGGCGWCLEREPAGRKGRWREGVGGGRLGKRAEGAGREKEPPGGGSQSCIVYSSFFRSSSGLSGWR